MSLLKIKNPFYLKTQDIQSSEVILLRHIRTVFNELNSIAKNKSDHEFVESVRFNKTLVDTEIMNNGEKDMIRANELSRLNIKHILVSPMRRALVTCQEALKLIEKSSQTIEPPVIEIHPYLFEKIEDSCDLIRPINENIEYFKEYSFRNKNYDVDWTNFNDITENINYYQLLHCRNTTINNKIIKMNKSHNYEFMIKAINENTIDYEDVQCHLIEEMKKLGKQGEHIENFESTFERIEKVNKRVNEIISNLDQSKNEKVLIIGHSMFFLTWYSEYVMKNTYDLICEDKKDVLKNCEILGVNLTNQEGRNFSSH